MYSAVFRGARERNETEDFVLYTVDEIVNYNYDHIYITIEITAMITIFFLFIIKMFVCEDGVILTDKKKKWKTNENFAVGDSYQMHGAVFLF